MSAPRENILIVPSRNALLTRSGWRSGRTRSSKHGRAEERDRLVVLKRVRKNPIS